MYFSPIFIFRSLSVMFAVQQKVDTENFNENSVKLLPFTAYIWHVEVPSSLESRLCSWLCLQSAVVPISYLNNIIC